MTVNQTGLQVLQGVLEASRFLLPFLLLLLRVGSQPGLGLILPGLPADGLGHLLPGLGGLLLAKLTGHLVRVTPAPWHSTASLRSLG